ncbi:MAG: pre-peptidase C-terminal domain-containing protein [Tildeniella nuda ZEHNDER 1965/U140]|jgi:VCBS repeat-containing protein|nr:pre-peptidase C-terminal domain-containing protein [Tildeniella nuda ZEHNDER 1965/U140]
MPADSVGNTLATAKQIFPIVSTQTSTEFIGVDAGILDANDYYSFKLSRTSSFTLSLAGLSANADVEILTSTGAIATGTDGSLLSSSNTGTLAESINNILDPGTYYIRVLPGPATDPLNPLTTTPSTNYSLNVAANSNTKTDIVWRNYKSGENTVWVMDGITRVSSLNIQGVGDLNWAIQATGDFNADGNTDIAWRNYATGEDVIWVMDGTTRVSSVNIQAVGDPNWKIQGSGDFNSDGTSDLLWRNSATGQNSVWFIRGLTLASSVFIEPLGPSYRIQAVADFNNDGNPDILWRDYTPSNVNNFVWLMNGTTRVGVADVLPAVGDLNWQIQGAVDLNDDGNSDLLWRNFATGQNVVWFLKGTTFLSAADLPITIDTNWRATPPFSRSLPVVRADAAGNTTTTAFSIGPVNGNGTYRDTVSTTDVNDYYQFSLGSTTQLSLALTGLGGGALNGNLDLQLYNAFGGVVASSANGGNAAESFTVNGLVAGTYYIQVAATAGSSAYDLNISANNLPVLLSNNALTLSEGSALTISNTLLQVTDENNTPAQLAYTLVVPPDSTKGALSLNGAAIAQNSIFTQADIDAGKLSYNQNGSETLTDSFVFSVSDGVGGTVANTTFTINTIPVNDPPTLSINTALTLSEGAAASLSSLNLLVADVEQSAAQLIYSLNSAPSNGSLLLNNTAIAAGSTFTQADITSGTKLSYSHNGSETTNDSFRFTATDGAGGTVVLSPQTFSLSVTPVNDAPILISNRGLTVTEGAAPIITSALLQTSDAEFTGTAISPQLPDQIIYTLGTAPINGTLFVGTNALTANGTFTQADVNNNRILYNHNGSKTNSDSFVFRVSDGTTVTTDSTFNIIVSPVNSPPVLSLNAGLTIGEGTTASIGSALLQVTDPDSPPPQVKYTLGQKPLNGDLKLNGTALTAGQTFTQQDINTLDRLTYQHNGSETTSDSFSFTASDPFGAVIPSTTFSIAVTPVNDAPTLLSNVGLTLSEGATGSITTTLLSAADVDNLDPQITYTASTPAHGSLVLGATTVTSFTQADLAGGQLKYVHDGSESISDSFSFTLSDGTAIVAARTFNVSVLPVNDLPGLANNVGLTLAEAGTSTIANTALLITDNDGPGSLTYTVGTGTTRGALKLGTATLAAGQTFTQADITGNRLSYTHDGSETTADSFTFTASDGSTGTLALTTFNIAVTPVNDAPVLVSNGGITLLEGALTTISSSVLQVSDGDSPPSTSLVYSVTNPPTSGTLLLAGSPVTSFTQANLNSGQLVYQHNGTESLSDSFTFNVTDGVVTTPVGPSVFNIAITPVNDAPGISNNLGLTLAEGATSTIASTALAITDNDGPGPLTYTLSAGTTRGSLKLGAATLLAGQTFTQADIASNSLSYTHDGTETTTDRFSFTASDNSTGTIALTTFSINVTPVNDAPALTVPGFQAVDEDLPLAFTGSKLISVSDADIGGNPLVVTLSASGGTLSLNPGSLTVNNNGTNLVTLTGQLTAVNNALSSLVYKGLLNFNGPDTISVAVTDQGSTGAGGAQTDTRTIDLIVNPINDAPTLTVPGAQAVLEDATLSLAGLLDTTDADSGTNPVRVNLTATNGALTLGTTGGLTFVNTTTNGSSTITATGTIDSIRAALATLSYQGNANYFGADAIIINVDDQGAVGASSALNIQRTIAVNVIPVNDAPSFTAGPNLVVNEDAAAQTVNWATGISTGPANESSQTLNFITSNNNASLFTVAPTIDPSGNLTYTLAPNANGVATVTTNLVDNGGTANGGNDTSPASTFTITANPVNDAPSFIKGANQTISEDAGAQAIAGWATAISAGPADEAAQTLNFLVNTDNPSLFSVAPTIDPATGTLIYTAAPNANGTAIVTVQLRDNGGTALGGADRSTLQTFTINVTAVNDAPVFTLPNPPTVSEDTTLAIAGISLTDVDSGSSALVVTLAVNSGTLQLGNTTGLTITAGSNNSSSIAFSGTLTDINAALSGLSYRGNLNFNGADTLTLTANDQGNTGSGAIGIDSRTLGITVGAVNDAPLIIVPGNQTVDEDTNLLLSGINITDADSNPNPITVTLTATNGTLTLDPLVPGSTTLTLTDTLDNINTAIANLTYRGRLNYNGADTITIRANDQGNAGFGGPLTDIKTINVNVNAVNDAPTLTVPGAQTVNEDTNLVFNAGRAITLTDVDSGANPVQVIFAVSNGSLTIGAVGGGNTLIGSGTSAITYSGTLAALTPVLNTLTYRGRQDYFGADTLSVIINDQGNTGSGSPGIATGSVAITVSSVNDAPVLLTNRSLTLSEGTSSVITNSQLRTTDVDNTPDLLVYTLFSAPNPLTSGSLRLSNGGGTTATLAAGGTFTQADVNSGYLSYLQNGSETTSDSFTFTVADNTPGSITVPGAGTATFNIVINPVNDAPAIVNNARLTLTEGGTSTISTTLLSVSDADNTTAQLRYTLSSTPNSGNVRLNGSALTIGQTFTQADIESTRISYRHNGSETTSDSFIFAVSDGAGGNTGSRTFNISITNTNDAPTIVSSGPATVNEGATLNLTNTLLRTSDPDNLTSELIYTLPTVPISGTLFLNGAALVGGATVTQQQIDQGALTYVHNGGEPNGNDAFFFQVSDGTTTLNTRIFNINVNPVNDAPVLVSNTGLLLAGDVPSLTVIGSDLLQVTDVDNTTAQLTYTLTSVPNPTVGVLRLNGNQVSAGQAFTQADIDSGNLSFDYIGNGSSETFQFTVSDGGVGGTLSNAFFYINFSYS